ncbi:hypothetical protein PGT21_002542 [Puccinia graminis f. sp. tritici]|uniref:Uncharacterized protein n=1 Tax=Puccinia graminis f. sp. tritici TaxID=56615 RepID=A0A5B0QM98_PUCGR|nr:hypothetical protein PGT21_002542 [Puccinia graminis f. sp. tritici]
MSAGHNPGSGKYWIGLGDTDTKFPRGSYRIAPADPNHLINRDWIGKNDPIPIHSIGGHFDPIPDKYRSGDRICYIGFK